MKKILLLTLLSFCLSTDITTKELILQIDETTESIDVADYLDLESGYYSVHLVYASIMSTSNDWHFFGGGLYEGIDISADGMSEDLYDFHTNGRFVTISSENSSLVSADEEAMIGLLYSSDGGEISLELTLHISGRFEDNSQTGDMNFDGDINVLDVIALVNVILDDDLGDIFDVIGLINKV